MPRKIDSGRKSELPLELSIKIPCKMAKRVEAYAKENGTDLTGVVIEALDEFLRERKER